MKKKGPRVSIGLPVYNGEKYIEKALESILNQTYTDFELIISDNASTDHTQAICEKYASKDQRISYVRKDKNMGAAPNYNGVFELSSGEYFKWAAHDDVIDPAFIAECVHVLDQNPEVVLCYSKATVIDENGNYLTNHDPEPDLTSLGPHQRFREFMFTSYLNIQMSGLMRSEILRKTCGYGSYPASDEVLSAELSLYGQFYEIPERLFKVRLHSGQSTFGALLPGQEDKKFKQRDRVLWFSTAYADKIILPTWLFYRGALKAILGAPLSGYQRTYCLALIVRRAFIPSHFRALGKDILLALQKGITYIYLKFKTKAGREIRQD